MTHHKLTWITGPTRSGKTTHLIQQFCTWIEQSGRPDNLKQPMAMPGVLVLAATGDNRMDLDARLTDVLQGTYPFHATTPLGFFQDEVILFWPLLIQQLDLKAQFPMRLHPENEQELATRLWRSHLDQIIAHQPIVNEERLVRRLLDLFQLTHLAGIPLEDMPTILQQGLSGQEQELPLPFPQVEALLQQWQDWCLERGLLTYGLMTALYWQHLLPHATYQRHLLQRYQMVLADDVDEYPAIARSLFEIFIQGKCSAIFTFNPDGAVRLGLGADPTYLVDLANPCQLVSLTHPSVPGLGSEWGNSIVEFVTDPMVFLAPPESIQTIQTTSRAELLRQVAELIVKAVQTGQVEPREVAVIAPGLDAIARYTLSEILTKHQIPVESLNDQRPLTSFPIIRALLTLLAFIYPGLGRLIDRDAVAEMLVVLTQKQSSHPSTFPSNPRPLTLSPSRPLSLIDPVRAGLLADYCFAPHPDRPRLLPPTTFPRWDRLGYQASESYQALLQWLEIQKQQLDQRLIPNAVTLLDRAIQHFLIAERTLPFDQLSALRQFIETAQHYWDIHGRLKQSHSPRSEAPASMTVSGFMQLLRNGTVTSNPYPVRPIGPSSNAVTLANVFQYRSNRCVDRWQFWLDAGSPRWLSGVDALFAAPLFLHGWSGRTWTAADAMSANEQRLRRILLDLLSRAEERVYLCHSDLATSGQEQTGILLSLVNSASTVNG